MFFTCRTNVVMNYTEIEAKVREATNDEAWGPTGGVLNSFISSEDLYLDVFEFLCPCVRQLDAGNCSGYIYLRTVS